MLSFRLFEFCLVVCLSHPQMKLKKKTWSRANYFFYCFSLWRLIDMLDCMLIFALALFDKTLEYC